MKRKGILAVLLAVSCFLFAACGEPDKPTPEVKEQYAQFRADAEFILRQGGYELVLAEPQTAASQAIAAKNAGAAAQTQSEGNPDTAIPAAIMQIGTLKAETAMNPTQYNEAAQYYKAAFPNYFGMPLIVGEIITESDGAEAPFYNKTIAVSRGEETTSTRLRRNVMAQTDGAYTMFVVEGEDTAQYDMTRYTSGDYTICAAWHSKPKADTTQIDMDMVVGGKYHCLITIAAADSAYGAATAAFADITSLYLRCIDLTDGTGVLLDGLSDISEAVQAEILNIYETVRGRYTGAWRTAARDGLQTADYTISEQQYDAAAVKYEMRPIAA